tara:strand:+ start:790 stop:2586 length:1797 start_codon:yes stop_codon:yes gene_type:complete
MLILHDTTKRELLTELVDATRENTDESRRALKKIFRKVISQTFQDGERSTFHQYTGKTINNITDLVAREVLVHLCVNAIGLPDHDTNSSKITGLAYDYGRAVRNLAVAYKDEDSCRPAARGTGVSVGYHKDMPTMDNLKLQVDELNLAWPVPDAVTQAEPTTETVEEIVEAFQQELETKPDEAASTAVAWETSTFHAVEPIPLDPTLKKAVDAVLIQASKGAITTTDYYTDHIQALNERVKAAENELDIAKSMVKSEATAPQAVTVDGSTLTYAVVMRKAMDLFKDAKGRASSTLDFDVETLVWYDADGKEVRHPACPDIDPHYKFRMHHIIKYLTAKKFRQHTWSHGHTGTGKTTFIEQVEARLGFPVERLNLDSNMERADVVGNVDIVVKDGAPSSVFTEGLLPVAMQQPMTFILDELDAGRPDMLFVLQRALENKGLTLTEDAGRLVRPHPLFSFAATANSRGQGDEHGWYSGVRPMNLAFLNRFGAFIEVNYMDEDDELQFLKDAYPKLNTVMAEQFARFAQLIRGAFMNGEISQTLSPRNLHAMAQYYQHFSTFMSHSEAVDEVIETCVSDAAPADNQQHIKELANRVFAGGL